MQKLSPSWQDLSDEQWQEACRREAVIRPLAEQDAVSRQAAAAAAEQLGIGPVLVYRLVARFRARPQTSCKAGLHGYGLRRSRRRGAFEPVVGNRATWLPKNPLRAGKRPAFAIRLK
jgi:hypothetical protein